MRLASPYGRGAPAGGGEGPLSHGRCRASSPRGRAKYSLPNSPDVPQKGNAPLPGGRGRPPLRKVRPFVLLFKGMKFIPKGYHNCQLSIVNCQFKNAPFLHFYFLHKIKTLPVAAAYLSARGSDGPLERDRKNHYQTALSTLLERRHLVQAYTWQGVPLTTALTRLTLGFQARLERLWEWETLIPKVTPLPQKSHFAIHCTSHPDNYFFCA